MTKATLDDKTLPHLQPALDPEAMARAFESFFRREYPERGLSVEACEIGRVHHKPGKNCDILYHLRCRDCDRRVSSPVLHGKMFADGEGHGKIHKAQPESWPGCGFWKPARFWPEMAMLVHVFPYDPKLPYLGQLLEPDFVKQQVEANLAGFGLPAGWRCEEVVSSLIKYMPTKRCILRYEIALADAAKNRRPVVFYGKTYGSLKSRHVYEALREICGSPACAAGVLNVPQPITHIDGANTLWQQAWEGGGFCERAAQLGWGNLPASGFVHKIAAMLAALHQIALPDSLLHPGPSPSTVLGHAEDEIAKISQLLPERQDRLGQVVSRLTVSMPDPAAPTPQATIHGTFKLAQILCRDDELALVDFDSIACGDPLYDLAEFVASLVYLGAMGVMPAASSSESVEIFLREYQQQAPWTCDRKRLAWYVVDFLLDRIHSALKRGDTVEVANISPAFDQLHAWLALVENGPVVSDQLPVISKQ
jgi:Ser/Thr protein kinase RdoA (MazF antagonist)